MNKEERKNIAEKHNKEMIKNYSNNTINSIKSSIVYSNDIKYNNIDNNVNIPEIEVVNMTTENAIDTYGSDLCVLNFASFTRPGGGFIKGSIAQEEALCHVSNLYNILVSFTDSFYNENFKSAMNNGLYKNKAIYSPNVKFIISNNEYEVNVITCAAPNYNAYISSQAKYDSRGKENIIYYDTLYKRIGFILDIASVNNQKTLILGAFGCGVFGNDPKIVSRCFKSLLCSPKYSFDKIIFAIPNSSRDSNYEEFKNTFKNK